jgi:hypothetical protein
MKASSPCTIATDLEVMHRKFMYLVHVYCERDSSVTKVTTQTLRVVPSVNDI